MTPICTPARKMISDFDLTKKYNPFPNPLDELQHRLILMADGTHELMSGTREELDKMQDAQDTFRRLQKMPVCSPSRKDFPEYHLQPIETNEILKKNRKHRHTQIRG